MGMPVFEKEEKDGNDQITDEKEQDIGKINDEQKQNIGKITVENVQDNNTATDEEVHRDREEIFKNFDDFTPIYQTLFKKEIEEVEDIKKKNLQKIDELLDMKITRDMKLEKLWANQRIKTIPALRFNYNNIIKPFRDQSPTWILLKKKSKISATHIWELIRSFVGEEASIQTYFKVITPILNVPGNAYDTLFPSKIKRRMYFKKQNQILQTQNDIFLTKARAQAVLTMNNFTTILEPIVTLVKDNYVNRPFPLSVLNYDVSKDIPKFKKDIFCSRLEILIKSTRQFARLSTKRGRPPVQIAHDITVLSVKTKGPHTIIYFIILPICNFE